ncbi:MAG: hypothetical protein AABN33_07900 [Acidobacteriota bacterium]
MRSSPDYPRLSLLTTWDSKAFALKVTAAEPSTAVAVVRLGRFGIYRFKFDQVQASLSGFTDDDLEGMISVIEKGNGWVRAAVNDFAFKTYTFLYSSHGALSDGTCSRFLLNLPRRPTHVFGDDLGSGILETWHDRQMDAKVRLQLDHSLQEPDGLYVSYMVLFERDDINDVAVAQQSRRLLESILHEIGLEFEADQLTEA